MSDPQSVSVCGPADHPRRDQESRDLPPPHCLLCSPTTQVAPRSPARPPARPASSSGGSSCRHHRHMTTDDGLLSLGVKTATFGG